MDAASPGERSRAGRGSVVVVPVRVFPVAGPNNYGDTFLAKRASGPHGGIDIFAAEGTPVLAVDEGHLQHSTNKLGGTVAKLLTADGTIYYYAHLSGYAGDPRPVHAGELVAYVGHTGNAANTPPHLHFAEYPPGQGVGPVDPYAELRAAQGLGPGPSPPTPRKRPTDEPNSGSGLVVLLVLYMLSRRG